MVRPGSILPAGRQAIWTHVTVSKRKYVSFAPLMKQPTVSAVMPCLNEERTLTACIRKAQACFRELGIEGEVVIADNGSTDRSVELATSLGARVVHQAIKGYGAALMKGIEEARGEIIVMADADDSYDWLAMGVFIARIREGFDLVMGNRFAGGIERGAMPALHRYLGNPVLSMLARVFHRAPIGDFHCGMRAFTKAAYERMRLRTTGMEFATEMVVNSVIGSLLVYSLLGLSLKAGAIYERDYLLGTSTARPIIARKQVEVALMTGCDALARAPGTNDAVTAMSATRLAPVPTTAGARAARRSMPAPALLKPASPSAFTVLRSPSGPKSTA